MWPSVQDLKLKKMPKPSRTIELIAFSIIQLSPNWYEKNLTLGPMMKYAENMIQNMI